EARLHLARASESGKGANLELEQLALCVVRSGRADVGDPSACRVELPAMLPAQMQNLSQELPSHGVPAIRRQVDSVFRQRVCLIQAIRSKIRLNDCKPGCQVGPAPDGSQHGVYITIQIGA